VHLIGLTGGIAAGKSVVAARLAEHGAVLIDADVLARAVVEPGTPALSRIAEEFGPGVLRVDGSLDRAALGAVVFNDPERLAALNGIVHPAVRELGSRLIAEATAADPDAVIVYDIPLLAESPTGPRRPDFDLIVVVHADRETRLRRLVELRGLSVENATRRLDAQATDEERLAIADVVIDANGPIEETLRQADRLWERLSSASGVGGPA